MDTRILSLLKGVDCDKLVALVLLDFIWHSQEDNLSMVTDAFPQYFPASSGDALWLCCCYFCNLLLWNPLWMVMMMLMCFMISAFSQGSFVALGYNWNPMWLKLIKYAFSFFFFFLVQFAVSDGQ